MEILNCFRYSDHVRFQLWHPEIAGSTTRLYRVNFLPGRVVHGGIPIVNALSYIQTATPGMDFLGKPISFPKLLATFYLYYFNPANIINAINEDKKWLAEKNEQDVLKAYPCMIRQMKNKSFYDPLLEVF